MSKSDTTGHCHPCNGAACQGFGKKCSPETDIRADERENIARWLEAQSPIETYMDTDGEFSHRLIPPGEFAQELREEGDLKPAVVWWVNVPVCDEHWRQIRGDREPTRALSAFATPSLCVKCDEPADIWVRAELRIP